LHWKWLSIVWYANSVFKCIQRCYLTMTRYCFKVWSKESIFGSINTLSVGKKVCFQLYEIRHHISDAKSVYSNAHSAKRTAEPKNGRTAKWLSRSVSKVFRSPKWANVSCNSHDQYFAIRCDLQRCKEPRATFFYRLEAANLGDLMRWWVRPGVRISHAAGFSRDVESAPKRNQSFRLSQAANPLSGQSDSGVGVLVNKKRKLLSGPPPPSPASLVLPLNIHVLVREY